jgi:hypothetical protein
LIDISRQVFFETVAAADSEWSVVVLIASQRPRVQRDALAALMPETIAAIPNLQSSCRLGFTVWVALSHASVTQLLRPDAIKVSDLIACGIGRCGQTPLAALQRLELGLHKQVTLEPSATHFLLVDDVVRSFRPREKL